MVHEIVYHVAYRLLTAIFVALIVVRVLTAREWTVRVWGGIVLIPLVLRALGIK